MNQGRYQAAGSESEFQPGSHGRVSRNRRGIRRVRDMAQADSAALLVVQPWALGYFGPTHRFTAADIALLHRRWLGGISTGRANTAT